MVVAFAARVISGSPTVGDESLEVATFTPDRIPWDELAFPSTHLALRAYLGGESGMKPPLVSRPPLATSPEYEALSRARITAFESKDVRAASLVYPSLIGLLRDERRFREALEIAEEGLGLTHDPLLARLADEIAHELAGAEQERC